MASGEPIPAAGFLQRLVVTKMEQQYLNRYVKWVPPGQTPYLPLVVALGRLAARRPQDERAQNAPRESSRQPAELINTIGPTPIYPE